MQKKQTKKDFYAEFYETLEPWQAQVFKSCLSYLKKNWVDCSAVNFLSSYKWISIPCENIYAGALPYVDGEPDFSAITIEPKQDEAGRPYLSMHGQFPAYLYDFFAQNDEEGEMAACLARCNFQRLTVVNEIMDEYCSTLTFKVDSFIVGDKISSAQIDQQYNELKADYRLAVDALIKHHADQRHSNGEPCRCIENIVPLEPMWTPGNTVTC